MLAKCIYGLHGTPARGDCGVRTGASARGSRELCACAGSGAYNDMLILMFCIPVPLVPVLVAC